MSAQPSSTMNFLIHDVNGQPQMVKVAGVKGTSNIIKSGQVVRNMKSDGSSPEGVMRTISLQSTKTGERQLVTLPMVRTISPESIGSSVFIKEEYIDEDAQQYQMEEPPQFPPHQQQVQSFYSSPQSVQTSVVMSTPGLPKYTPPYQYQHSTGKKRASDSEINPGPYKRSRGDKASKGLRHFSMKVCEKVRRKGVTTYNEVADELVQEFSEANSQNSSSEQYDQKNIRRRVYDALNVLMAMNIISKEKKEIKWLGLPTNSLQESLNLNKERRQLIQRINQKTQQLHELLLQQISLKKLIQKNVDNEKIHGEPAPNSAIHLPFLIVSTNKQTVIDCSMSNDKTEYLFVFDDKFEIHEDMEILKRMGLSMGLDKQQWTEEDVMEAKRLVAPCMEKYVNQIAHGDGLLVEDDEALDMDEEDNSQITIETVMPEEALSVSSDGESDLSSDIDHV